MTTAEILVKYPNIVEIKKTDSDIIEKLVGVFSRACKGNPLLEYILGSSGRREKTERHYFRYMLRSGIKYGKVFAILENGEPYSFGMMAGNSDRLYSLPYQIAAGALRMLFGCGLAVVYRSLVYEQAVAKIRKKHLPPNHLYGYFLAVDPVKQRDAFRSSKFLLEGCLLWAEENNLVFYFETMSERHRYYYEKHGFKSIGTYRFEKAGIDFHAMIKA